MDDPNPDHAALRRVWRKLEIMRQDAATGPLQADIAEVMKLVTAIAKSQGFDTKTCAPISTTVS